MKESGRVGLWPLLNPSAAERGKEGIEGIEGPRGLRLSPAAPRGGAAGEARGTALLGKNTHTKYRGGEEP